MKKLLFLLIVVSLPVRAFYVNPEGDNSWSRTCLLFMAGLVGQVLAQNCTPVPPEPYALTDGEIYKMVYFQMGAGAFAVVSIVSSPIAAWYFYKRQEKVSAKEMQEDFDEITKSNQIHQDRIDGLRPIIESLARARDG